MQNKESYGEAKERSKFEKKKQVQEEFNKKLPTYDPRNGGKSSLHLGDDKVDYRNKNDFYSIRHIEKKGSHTKSQITLG